MSNIILPYRSEHFLLDSATLIIMILNFVLGIILLFSSWFTWPTCNPLKMVVDHLTLTLLSLEGLCGPASGMALETAMNLLIPNMSR